MNCLGIVSGILLIPGLCADLQTARRCSEIISSEDKTVVSSHQRFAWVLSHVYPHFCGGFQWLTSGFRGHCGISMLMLMTGIDRPEVEFQRETLCCMQQVVLGNVCRLTSL